MNLAYLGIDVGTTGVRACCIDQDKNTLSIRSISLPEPVKDGANIHQDPEIWWDAVKRVIGASIKANPQHEIMSISIDGTSGTVLVTDNDNNPLADALMYNDQSCVTESETITSTLPKESAAHGPSSGLSKALHLYMKYPEASHICHQADWLTGRLTGRSGTSDENNCLKTGYDVIRRQWPAQIAELHIDMGIFPEVVVTGTSLGHIDPQIAKELGLDDVCSVIAGTTDSIAAFVATGANEPGTGVSSLGSTLALKMVTEQPVYSVEHGIYSHRLGDLWLVGGASNSGGNVLKHFFSDEELIELSNQIEPSIDSGYGLYPLLTAGERFPHNDPMFEPIMEPRPTDDATYLQALLEGIARIEREGYAAMAQLSDTPLKNIITTGGGSSNEAWTKMRHRLIGVTISRSQCTDASFGSALIAKGELKRN